MIIGTGPVLGSRSLTSHDAGPRSDGAEGLVVGAGLGLTSGYSLGMVLAGGDLGPSLAGAGVGLLVLGAVGWAFDRYVS